MKLPELAVKRPVTVSMLVLVTILMGVISLTRLPVDLLPEMGIPVAAIATSYEGAGPSEVESLVSRPIEEVVTSVGGVKRVSSTSGRGQSVVIVEFDWGTDMDFATLELREKVDLVKPILPDDVGDPRVLTFDPSASPVLELGMGGNREIRELKQIADDVVKNRLERIAGVAAARVLGGRERQIHVLADASLMRAYGITFDHMIQSLRAANLNLPGGRIEIGDREVTVRTTGEFSSLREIQELMIPTAAGQIPLRDVAQVTFGESDIEIYSRIDGRPGIWIEIMKETGANTVSVANAIHEAIEQLKKELGDDIQFVTISDESRFIQGSLQSVSENGIIGGILAMVVLLAFLRNFRTTLIIATAIPISIVLSFFLIYMSGMTLNMMSLGGLALGIGMLVDNGIVVIENIFRHRQLGKNAFEAAVEGTSEVGTAIIASTLTTVAVFVPVIFVQGLASQIFKDLSLTITFSLAASLAVSITLIPMLASRLLGGVATPMFGVVSASTSVSAEPTADRQIRKKRHATVGRFYDGYARFLGSLLRRKWLLYLGVLMVMGVSLALFPFIGQEFMPPFDEGQIIIDIEMPKGTRLDETNRVVTQVEMFVSRLPDVEAVLATAGTVDAPDVGRVSIHLVPRSQRQNSSSALVEHIRRNVAQIPGAYMSVTSSSGFMSEFGGAAIQIQVRGDDVDELQLYAERVAEVVRNVRGTRDVKAGEGEGRPELQVHVDREKASRLGLSVAQIAGAVRTAVAGQTATIYRSEGEEIDIVVRLGGTQLSSVNDLYQIPLGTAFGGTVPLVEVATLEEGISPVSINRSDQSRAVLITANLADRDLGSVMNDIRAGIAELGLPGSMEVEYAGEAQQMQEAFSELGLAMILGVILVYAVMASQFESLIQPLVIIFTVPFSFIGVLWGLFLSGHTLNVAAIVGVIMMAGVAVNNAIVLIDFINQLRARGVEREQAIIEAGRTRVRPILMTTLTTVLGMIPLMLGIGEGSEVMAPLAVVVVGGLITSTFLTLIVVPSLYMSFDELVRKIRQITGRTAA